MGGRGTQGSGERFFVQIKGFELFAKHGIFLDLTGVFFFKSKQHFVANFGKTLSHSGVIKKISMVYNVVYNKTVQNVG